jgi:ribose transport system ATP-binding protein
VKGTARLVARGLRKSFQATRALDGVDIALAGGEILALVGANGAGKSTLVKIVCGAVMPDAGGIEIDGKPVVLHGVADAYAAGIAVAHQQVTIIPCLDGAENIMLGREPRRGGLIDTQALRREARALAERFGVAIDLRRECAELSLGELKILDILKAIAHDPAVLILDEPTASLSIAESRRLFEFLDDLRRRGLAILFISHHLNEVFEHCDRMVVLKDGRKVFDGPVSGAEPAEVVRLMVGRAIEAADWRPGVAPGETVVALADAVVSNLRIPELAIRAGEVVGIAGVLGAGQTELLERLAGVPHPAHAASARVAGLQGLPRSVRQAVAAGICLVADNRVRKALFRGLDVRENLASASLRELSRVLFMSGRREQAAATDIIGRLGVKCAGSGQEIMHLSGGNQQKVAFGRWLLRLGQGGRPRVPALLLLDNPTEGVDVGAKADIYALIRDFARQGAAVLIASAEFAELLALCDRVHCIAGGRLGPPLGAAGLTEDRLLLEVS